MTIRTIGGWKSGVTIVILFVIGLFITYIVGESIYQYYRCRERDMTWIHFYARGNIANREYKLSQKYSSWYKEIYTGGACISSEPPLPRI
jgi:hypothetical protein